MQPSTFNSALAARTRPKRTTWPAARSSQPVSEPIRGTPSIDDQVQSLAQQFNLSADQQAKVKTALEDQHTQAMNIVQDNSMSRDDKIQKIHSIREGTINKARTTLNDDQKKKFDTLVQQQSQHFQQTHPQAQPQPKQ